MIRSIRAADERTRETVFACHPTRPPRFERSAADIATAPSGFLRSCPTMARILVAERGRLARHRLGGRERRHERPALQRAPGALRDEAGEEQVVLPELEGAPRADDDDREHRSRRQRGDRRRRARPFGQRRTRLVPGDDDRPPRPEHLRQDRERRRCGARVCCASTPSAATTANSSPSARDHERRVHLGRAAARARRRGASPSGPSAGASRIAATAWASLRRRSCSRSALSDRCRRSSATRRGARGREKSRLTTLNVGSRRRRDRAETGPRAWRTEAGAP